MHHPVSLTMVNFVLHGALISGQPDFNELCVVSSFLSLPASMPNSVYPETSVSGLLLCSSAALHLPM